MQEKYASIARESIVKYSPEIVDVQQILTVLLDAPELCGKLSAIGIRELEKMSIPELEELGLEIDQVLKLRASFLFARKWAESAGKIDIIKTPNDAGEYLTGVLKNKTQEHFYLLCLGTKNQVVHERTVFVGTLNASIVHPREIFQTAVKYSAAAIIVAHNHPSGDPTPSTEDIEVTKRLLKAGEVMGITCMDHLIIGDGYYISLKDKGYI